MPLPQKIKDDINANSTNKDIAKGFRKKTYEA